MRQIVYIVSAELLHRLARELQPPEKVRFLTGIPLFSATVIVLTDTIEVEMESASRAGAKPHPRGVFRISQELGRLGMTIDAQAHSHPGLAPEATRPSRIDLETARVWERDAPFLGLIFSEGGRYVRFFNHGQKSVVQIYGNVIPVSTHLFEIPVLYGAEVPATSDGGGRLAADASATALPVVGPAPPESHEGTAGWLRWARQQYRENSGSDGLRTD
jgi:hypothetical protein